jgi:alpha-galactosidase
VVNNWEATGFSFDTDRILTLIDQAADLGAELFLLDDG